MSKATDEALKSLATYHTEHVDDIEKWAYVKGFEDAWIAKEKEIEEERRELWNAMTRSMP